MAWNDPVLTNSYLTQIRKIYWVSLVISHQYSTSSLAKIKLQISSISTDRWEFEPQTSLLTPWFTERWAEY